MTAAMLNTEKFVLLAGRPELWDAEVLAFTDVGGSLAELQKRQHERGRRSAMLHHTGHGWTVAYDVRLDYRTAIVHHFSRDGAIWKGIGWANDDPKNREFYAFKSDLS